MGSVQEMKEELIEMLNDLDESAIDSKVFEKAAEAFKRSLDNSEGADSPDKWTDSYERGGGHNKEHAKNGHDKSWSEIR